MSWFSINLVPDVDGKLELEDIDNNNLVHQKVGGENKAGQEVLALDFNSHHSGKENYNLIRLQDSQMSQMLLRSKGKTLGRHGELI